MESTGNAETETEEKVFIDRDGDDDGKEENTVTVTLINPTTSSTESGTLKRQGATPPRVDLSRSDLVRLLSYLEGELQARDVVIATLKAEKAKQMLYQAKYGRLGLNDPFAALQRDSETCCSKDDFDEASVGRLYESQLAHLERLIAVQRRAHQRAKQVLAGAERRHARSVRELEQEKKRRAHDAAQGDDVCMMLEKERERLKQELENQKCEQAKLARDLEKSRQLLADEKERHKQMVVYLLQERRQLLVRLMEERQKAMKAHEQKENVQQNANVTQGTTNKPESKDQELFNELQSLKQQLEEEKKETATLREIVKSQEEDLNLIRQMILSKSRQAASQQPSPTAGAAKTSEQAKSSRNEHTTVGPGHHTTGAVSPAIQGSSKHQSGQRVAHDHHHHHYAATDLDSPSTTVAQQPIRVLTNPAYQQSSPYSGPTKTAAPTRTRPVPPPAPHQPALPHATDRVDSAQATHNSTYASPRVIPIQLIGPSTPSTSSSHPVGNHQHQHYASVSTAGGLRRPGSTSVAPSSNQGGMVSAARNYVSNVVAAVTYAANSSPLLSGGGSARRSQTSAPTYSGSGGGSSREQWSHVPQTAPAMNDGSGYRAPSANAHHSAAVPVPQQVHHGKTPTGSVARKGNNTTTRASPSTGSSQQQQVSVDGSVKMDRTDTVHQRGRTTVGNPIISDSTEPVGGPNCGGRWPGNDSHGVKGLTSRRPPPSPQSHNSPPSVPTVNSGNGPTTTTVRSRPASPVLNTTIPRQSPVPNGSVVQGSGGGATVTGIHVPGKRTPTPAPSNRTPYPTATNGIPAPAAMKTTALSGSPSTSMTDCNAPVIINDTHSRQSSPASTSQGTIGRKVKAMSSSLASKIQKSVAAGGSGQQQRSQEDTRNSNSQNIRSTQV